MFGSERIRKIVTQVINICWFFFRWGFALAVVAVIAAVWYFRGALDDEVRAHVEHLLARNLVGLEANIQSARLIEGEGIVIRGLSLTERKAGGPYSELAYLEEVFIACRTDLKDLLSEQLKISRVTFRRPTFRVTRRTDGSWSLGKLFEIDPAELGVIDLTTIENGTVIVFDPTKNPSSSLTLRELNLVVKNGGGQQIQMEGSITGEHLSRAEFQGAMDPTSGHWKISGHVDDVAISSDMLNAVPSPLDSWLRPIESVTGQAALQFRADYQAGRTRPLNFDIRVQLERGRLDDRRLPWPLTDVTGSILLTQEGISIENMAARSGRTAVWLRGYQRGYGGGRPLSLKLQVNRLVLDSQLFATLPGNVSDIWKYYAPTGEVDARLQLEFDGQHWYPDLAVTCKGVEFTNYRFPYRLTGGEGNVSYRGGVVTIGLTAFGGGGRPVKIQGSIQNPGHDATGEILVQAAELPIEHRLIRALPATTQAVVYGFSPQGAIDGFVRVQRQSSDQPWQHHWLIDLKGLALRCEKFAYPLRDVRGRLEGRDAHWTFTNLSGRNDSGVVKCDGHLQPSGEGHQLTLNFIASNVPLDEELKAALAPGLQSLWSQIQPSGRVNLRAELQYNTVTGQTDLAVHTDLGKTGILVDPVFFPYRLEELRGEIVFGPGRAGFRGLTARHGKTSIGAEGFLAYAPDGSWQLQLEKLTADRLRADRDFLRAVPSGLRDMLSALNFSGPINIDGSMSLTRTLEDTSPRSSWNLSVNTIQGRVDSAVALDQINGGLKVTGSYDGQRATTRGWMEIDSLIHKGMQFTGVRGPIFMDNDQLLFGAWADPGQPGEPPRRISANFYGGSMVGDCRVLLGETPQFVLDADLADGNLAQFSAEAMRGTEDLSGRILGNLHLQGNARGTHTFRGSGIVRMSDANIYQVPLILSLLKLLAIKTPSSKGFSSGEIDFRIDGNHVLFDRMNFYGDAISLLGKGEMDFDTNVRMVFHPIVGNDQRKLPLIRPVLGLAGKQLMMIYVYGTLDDPRTTREALPGLRRAVEGLQGEVEHVSTNPNPLRQASDWLQALLPRR